MSKPGPAEIERVRDIVAREMPDYEVVTDRLPGERDERSTPSQRALAGEPRAVAAVSPSLETLKLHYTRVLGRECHNPAGLIASDCEHDENDLPDGPNVRTYLVRPRRPVPPDADSIAVVISLDGGEIIAVQT